MKIRSYESGALDTPALRRCPEAGSVPALTSKGNLDLLNRRLITFFCSVRCPGDVILKTYDLARALRSTGVTLIGGFQSAERQTGVQMSPIQAIGIVFRWVSTA